MAKIIIQIPEPKENYSAEDEVNALKEEFADLRKSLLAEKEAIVKAQTEASALPDNFPTSMDDIAKMDWNELHDLVREFE